MQEKLGRREFLKGIGTAGTVLAGAGLLAACAPNSSEQQYSLGTAADSSVEWTDETDILVVGSGFAALAAAIEVKQAGVDVKVIEKMPTLGGNSTINGGDLAAVGTKLQLEAGVSDSFELMQADMLKAGKNYNHVERVKTVVENSKAAVEWCESIGVEFTKLNFHGGHSVPRTNTTKNATGSDIVRAQIEKFEELGGEIQTETILKSIITNDSGRVIGIAGQKNYDINSGQGTPIYIKANKAVILATGGFSNDVQMRQIHEPRLTDALTSTNHAGATGEALREALKLGAMDVHMDWIQLGPWTSPDEPGFGYTPQFCERLVGHGLMVDPKTGKRFVNETGDRKVRADAMLSLGYSTLVIGDDVTVQRQVIPRILEGGMAAGVILKFDSLEALADNFSIPKEEFLAEVQRWNSFVEKGTDDDFAALIQTGATPTQTAPYYAAKLWPKVHHTMGGLVTNLKAQVLNQNLEPICGLYAAGEVTGGTHGAVRLGSCAVTDCIVFGRIAGQEAAKEQA
ncbi:MAG: flavocytochrome c [Coriobacteriales bacterium]|nr:flavocytochrome c [Coriobacteriales bacterium]